MRRRGTIAFAAALVLLLALCTVAIARPGGGESFSGGGGHGGGGGGGDDGSWIVVIELLIRLIWLCVYYPYIGLPLVAALVVAIVVGTIWNRRNKDWNSGPPVTLKRSLARSPEPEPDTRGPDVRAVDPDFSWVLFEDFVFRLFATAHGARGNPAAMAALAPYLADAARTALLQRDPQSTPVTRVIVGAQRVYSVVLPSNFDPPTERNVRVSVEFEANTTAGGHTWYTVERWTFTRSVDARTKAPRPTRDFPCPNCGAPWPATAMATTICAYCGQAVDNGRFDWQVSAIELLHADPRPPTLTAEVPERGTDLPTYRDPRLSAEWQRLLADDPALSREAFDARVDLAYRTLNDAWSKNDLAPARAFCSDGIYDYLGYWVDAYAAQGLHNQLDDMRITKRELAKVTRDRWYDAVTVRLWATGKDYVVDREGKHVRGSRSRERPYSEYWTFVRSHARRGPAHADKTCPNCGAPLAINMGGGCASCGVHVTAGELDWVLSKIEQDDTYRG